MSYFPTDIPFMSEEELKANGIKVNCSEKPNNSGLRKCPFCGSEHVVCTKPTTWQVWCTDCKCIGPWKTERKDAIEAWNRRME